MKRVTGTVNNAKPVSLAKDSTLLSGFVSSETQASQDVSAYLRRASAGFTELKSVHKGEEDVVEEKLNSMAPRWKRKGAEAKALAEPISKSVSELQLSLAKTESSGSLSSCNVLLAVEPEQADLLGRCCFGTLVLSAEKVKKWIQLSFEEAFYLLYILKCIKLTLQGRCLENQVETWMYMRSKRPNFPVFFKAYDPRTGF